MASLLSVSGHTTQWGSWITSFAMYVNPYLIFASSNFVFFFYILRYAGGKNNFVIYFFYFRY
jgi:hypothetical protein